MIIALLSVLIVSILLVVYPYGIYPLLLKLLPTNPVEPNTQDRGRLTLVFSAFNEMKSINEKLDNIAELKARHPDLEVLAYDDGSTDDTLAALRARGELLTVISGKGRQGKAHGMKQLAAQAKGDILVFTDANVMLDPSSLDRIGAWFCDPNVGGLCGTLHYLDETGSTTASVGGAYWRLEEKIKDEESRSGNVMGADGSIFATRRSLYPDFPDTVLDDLTVSMAVVFAGKRLIKCNDVVAYERLVSSRKEEFSRKVRISARAFHTHLHLRPQLRQMAPLDRFKYTSRKLIRWFGGLFLIVGIIAFLALCALVSPWLGVAATIGMLGVAVFGTRLGFRPLDAVLEISLALIATLVGVVKAMRGKTFQTWTPANTR